MNEEVDDEEEVDGPNCATTAAAAADVAISDWNLPLTPEGEYSNRLAWRVESRDALAHRPPPMFLGGGWRGDLYHASFVCSPAFSLGHGPTRPGVHFAGFLPISRGADYGSYGRG